MLWFLLIFRLMTFKVYTSQVLCVGCPNRVSISRWTLKNGMKQNELGTVLAMDRDIHSKGM
ncbi:hypothetical protein GCM10008018_08210 [Paenibacillus marchantiophytorum]|uniref:Helix-turn-helix domain-containing protein n=1 Tax=Paenibacillus marchantiophytorum TaxID=1619310 RepID=A0ABQ2BPS4_9BACL|nr:hypothetical protein GCM10008018_08210 [Paenibacillus marchantiophytorum]